MSGGLSPDRVKADYAASFARVGEDVLIRRYSGPAGPSRPHVDTPARARATECKPEELIGPIIQGDRNLVVLVDAAVTAILPVLTTDKMVIRGKECAIRTPPDDNTRRLAGVLIALELTAAG